MQTKNLNTCMINIQSSNWWWRKIYSTIYQCHTSQCVILLWFDYCIKNVLTQALIWSSIAFSIIIIIILVFTKRAKPMWVTLHSILKTHQVLIPKLYTSLLYMAVLCIKYIFLFITIPFIILWGIITIDSGSNNCGT